MTFSLRLFFLLALFSCTTELSAQNSFQKIYGGAEFSGTSGCFVPALDSGYLVAGTMRAAGPFMAVRPFLAQFDDDGAVLWQKTYPTETDAHFRILLPANDGGYLGVGMLRSATGGSGTENILVIKTDAQGNFLWSKNHSVNTGNIWPDQARAVSDGYLIGGHKWNDSPGLAYLLKINNDGDLVWNRHYDAPGYTYVIHDFLLEGDTAYAVTDGLFLAFPLDGGPVYAANAYADTSGEAQLLRYIFPSGDGNFFLLGSAEYAVSSFPNNDNNAVSLRKVRKDGALLWSKRLWLPGLRLGLAGLQPTPDGGFVMHGNVSPGQMESRAVLVKINADAELQWAFQYTHNPSGNFEKTLVLPDGSIISEGSVRFPASPPASIRRMLLVKTLPDGRVEGCCTAPLDVQVSDNPATALPQTVEQFGFNGYSPVFSLVAESLPFPDSQYCSYSTALRHDTLRFCPGESLTLNGVTYTQPATVTDTILSPFACDTIVTYTLEFTDLSQPSNLAVQCPAGISIVAAAGATSAVVHYADPASAGDCPCGTPGLELVQGLASGADFPVGVTQVCYEVADDCGSAASCCFTVTVEAAPVDEDEPCDVKNTACVRFEILGIFQNPAGQKTYRLRATNHCANKLVYLAFQLPDGVTADEPANGTTYTTSGGRQYAVRNANASPFHSIRFKALGDGIAGGQSDVFEYTLQPQAAPVFIHATARLEPQVFYETHLNVFDCVVEFTAARPIERGVAPETVSPIAVFPNPVSAVLQVDLSAWAAGPVRLLVFDAVGRLRIDQAAAGGTPEAQVDFSALPKGIYALVVTNENGARHMARVVRM